MSTEVLKVVVIDDNAWQERLVKQQLKSVGLNPEVAGAVSYPQAVKLISDKELADVYVLDYNIGHDQNKEGNGLSFVKIIEELAKKTGLALPIIILCSNSSEEKIREIEHKAGRKYPENVIYVDKSAQGELAKSIKQALIGAGKLTATGKNPTEKHHVS